MRIFINGKYHRVHRLIALTYLANPKNLPEINHKNGVRNDNNIDNLEWCNHLYQMQDAVRRGTHSSIKMRKLSANDRASIRELRIVGLGAKKISEKLGLSYHAVRSYIRGDNYKWDAIGINPTERRGYFWDIRRNDWCIKFKGRYIARVKDENDAKVIVEILKKNAES